MDAFDQLFDTFHRYVARRRIRANLMRVSRRAMRLATDNKLTLEQRARLIEEIGQINADTFREVRRLENAE